MSSRGDYTSQISTPQKDNSRLFELLATNYSITNLANRINASKYAQMNVLNLKRNGKTSI